MIFFFTWVLYMHECLMFMGIKNCGFSKLWVLKMYGYLKFWVLKIVGT